MQIIRWAFYPVTASLYFSKELITIVINRIALEVFVTYHQLRQTEKSTEIEYLSKAIDALENNQEAKPHLSPLLKNNTYTPRADITDKQLLEALKIYRFSATCLWKGIDHTDNQSLRVDIYSYLIPKTPQKQ